MGYIGYRMKMETTEAEGKGQTMRATDQMMKPKSKTEIKAAFMRWNTIRNRCGAHPAYTQWDAPRAEMDLLTGLIQFAAAEIADHGFKYWGRWKPAYITAPSMQYRKQAVRACRNLLERKTRGWRDAAGLDCGIEGAGWCDEDGIHWARKWEDVTTWTVDIVCARFGLKHDDLDDIPWWE